MNEELLTGGNTHGAVVRVDETVRRPTGPWTPGVHALLRHLEAKSFDGSPRVVGIDSENREILTFVPGDVVYPDHLDLVMTDEGLVAIATLVRKFHDTVSDFDSPVAYTWSDRASDTHLVGELVCHNDLAPWNLVHTPDGRWVFIDWDLAAPGPRSWDLAWALLTFIPLMPGDETDHTTITHRLTLFRDAYGAAQMNSDVMDVAVSRCQREANLIATLGGQREPPYDRLLAEGHFHIWSRAAEHVKTHAGRWKKALS